MVTNEGGRNHREVEKMARAKPGIVSDIDVAGLHALRDWLLGMQLGSRESFCQRDPARSRTSQRLISPHEPLGHACRPRPPVDRAKRPKSAPSAHRAQKLARTKHAPHA